MKKLFIVFVLVVVFIFAGCDNGYDTTSITGETNSELEQVTESGTSASELLTTFETEIITTDNITQTSTAPRAIKHHRNNRGDFYRKGNRA